MVIGFDGSRAFIENRTGTENYSYQLLKHLAKIDKKNSYIVYVRPKTVILNLSKTDEGSLARLADALAKRANARTFKWPGNFKFITISWPRLWTQGGLAIQTFKDNLDVLFVPSHTLPLIRRQGLKTVITVHDLGSQFLPATHQLKQRLYLSFIQRYQLKTATRIIAVSKATKLDLINKIGIDEDKISIVYEGYNKELFNDTKGNSLRQYFLFVGTVQPRKNLERIIRAFSSLLSAVRQKTDMSDDRRLMTDDYSLVIAGSKGWLSDEIYTLPKRLGIEGRVKFLGYVPDRDLPKLYKGAIALVFPSLFEGFGLPILEAQACSCPVITSNLSSMPEVAGQGAILINPYNIEDITNAMIRVREKALRVKLIKQGLQNVKRFNWEKCAKETLKVLENV